MTLRTRPLHVLTVVLVAFGLWHGAPLVAQSCILTQLDSPVVNAFDPNLTASLEDSRWTLSFGWRYGHADRHFVGTTEQKHRQAENSQVENIVHLLDLGLRYRFDQQNEISIGIPYLMARREGPIRDADRNLIGRQVRSNTRGIGDIAVIYHRRLWNPETHPRSNITLGLGLEFPTGDNSQQDSLLIRQDDGSLVPESRTADQSVQPGDGGFGFVVQGSGYKLLNAAGTWAVFGSLTYIIAPETDSGTLTYRSRAGEQIMSIADQYAARAGVQFAVAGTPWSFGLGGRIEGVPVHDLFGSSTGFRRPGYIVSAEPSVSWTRGVHSVSFSVPVAVQRNRERSVPDLANDHHGDASFPDYIVLAGYSVRF